MVRGPNGRRHRYVPRKRRRQRGLQRGGVLPMLAMALSPWAVKKRQRRACRRLSDENKKKSRHICCVAGVGRFLPEIGLGHCLNSRHIMEWRMERQAPFLKSILQEANQHKRQELLRMANADQFNAISELVVNTIRGTVPCSRHTITLLKPHAQSLRTMAKATHSVKQGRAIMMSQKGGNLWSELYRCYKRCMR